MRRYVARGQPDFRSEKFEVRVADEFVLFAAQVGLDKQRFHQVAVQIVVRDLREKIVVQRGLLEVKRTVELHSVRERAGLLDRHALHLFGDKCTALAHVLVHLPLRIVVIDRVQHVERRVQRAVAVAGQVLERDSDRFVLHVVQPERAHALGQPVPLRRLYLPVTIRPLRRDDGGNARERIRPPCGRRDERARRYVHAVVVPAAQHPAPLARIVAGLARRETVVDRRVRDPAPPPDLEHNAVDRVHGGEQFAVHRRERKDRVAARVREKVHLIEHVDEPVAVPRLRKIFCELVRRNKAVPARHALLGEYVADGVPHARREKVVAVQLRHKALRPVQPLTDERGIVRLVPLGDEREERAVVDYVLHVLPTLAEHGREQPPRGAAANCLIILYHDQLLTLWARRNTFSSHTPGCRSYRRAAPS